MRFLAGMVCAAVLALVSGGGVAQSQAFNVEREPKHFQRVAVGQSVDIRVARVENFGDPGGVRVAPRKPLPPGLRLEFAPQSAQLGWIYLRGTATAPQAEGHVIGAVSAASGARESFGFSLAVTGGAPRTPPPAAAAQPQPTGAPVQPGGGAFNVKRAAASQHIPVGAEVNLPVAAVVNFGSPQGVSVQSKRPLPPGLSLVFAAQSAQSGAVYLRGTAAAPQSAAGVIASVRSATGEVESFGFALSIIAGGGAASAKPDRSDPPQLGAAPPPERRRPEPPKPKPAPPVALERLGDAVIEVEAGTPIQELVAEIRYAGAPAKVSVSLQNGAPSGLTARREGASVVLSGVIEDRGDYRVVVVAQAPGARAATMPLILRTLRGTSAPEITLDGAPIELPFGQEASVALGSVADEGGVAGLRTSWEGLPNGMRVTLQPDGALYLEGAPIESGAFDAVVLAFGSSGESSRRSFRVSVSSTAAAPPPPRPPRPPRTPPSAAIGGPTDLAAQIEFARDFDAGACVAPYALEKNAEDRPVFFVVSPSLDAVVTLDAAFIQRFGFEATFKFKTVNDDACSFIRSLLRSAPLKPRFNPAEHGLRPIAPQPRGGRLRLDFAVSPDAPENLFMLALGSDNRGAAMKQLRAGGESLLRVEIPRQSEVAFIFGRSNLLRRILRGGEEMDRIDVLSAVSASGSVEADFDFRVRVEAMP